MRKLQGVGGAEARRSRQRGEEVLDSGRLSVEEIAQVSIGIGITINILCI